LSVARVNERLPESLARLGIEPGESAAYRDLRVDVGVLLRQQIVHVFGNFGVGRASRAFVAWNDHVGKDRDGHPLVPIEELRRGCPGAWHVLRLRRDLRRNTWCEWGLLLRWRRLLSERCSDWNGTEHLKRPAARHDALD
jgi:hypothetical protein